MGTKQKAICILGMHRSGTSAMTRAINLLGGVYLGEETDLIPPDTDNPEGYWERIDINILLNRILDRHMRGWDATLPLPEGWHLSEEVKPFRSELTELIKRAFSGHSVWAWKDPRTSILFNLWKHVLQDLNTELVCLFMLRNPLDVASSLERRNGMPRDRAYGVWFNYNVTALNAISGIPCVFVSYDRLLADWETELTRCAKGLGIPWPVDGERLHKEMNAFLRPELRHSSSTLEDIKAADAPRPIVELYEILLRVSNDRETPGQAFNQNVERLSKEFSSYSRFFRDDMEKQNILVKQFAEKERELESIQSSFGQQLAEKEWELDSIRSSLGWKILTRCRRIVDRCLPIHTRRRTVFDSMIKDISAILHESWMPLVPSKEERKRRADSISLDTAAAQYPTLVTENKYFDILFEMNNSMGKDYVPVSHPELPNTDIKLIAFYLPQFHPIPENDEWWGKNFTEWTNVTRAVPQFVGHYQPRLPGELGFYDLRFPEIQQRQIELAKQYGIHGFCFHFYWFNGKRLLEKPLEQFLSTPGMDFPFCINWANENWTRQWDGRDKEILIAQRYAPEDDLTFITYVSKYLKDKRYIRINSKPLLIVYRPALLPDPRQTAERWRAWCRQNGIGEIYLALTHSFEHLDPRQIGFDAAIEFAPNTFPLREITARFHLANDNYQGRILDYEEALYLARKYKNPPYTKFRGICPGWDNEARRPGRGMILANSSPEAYKQWLEILCDFTRWHFDPQERLIFINAWNEWAEGAYLEPDRKYGYAYLQKNAEALSSSLKESTALPEKWRILFVSHDASRAGAQNVLINIISWFKNHTPIDLKILCVNGGKWLYRFNDLGDVLVLSELIKEKLSEEDIIQKLREFCGYFPDLIYGNSVAAGQAYPLLHRLNAPIVTHFHELEMSIERYAAEWINNVLKYSSLFIACSGAVRENLVKNHGVDPAKITTVYDSISPDSSVRLTSDREKRKIRKRLRIKKDKFLVFGCGTGMVFRKGADLFIEVARTLCKKGVENFHFYWIGGFDWEEGDNRYGLWADHLSALRKGGLDRYVTFLGFKDNLREYFLAGDLFLLPSREDPFPLVVLLAAECGLPTVCFADAGGMPDFVEEDAGYVVPYEDVEAMAEKVMVLMENGDLRRKFGVRARQKLLSRFTSEKTTPHILSACRMVAQKNPAVSVIVPNFNHVQYLPKRLDSIFNQTFKDFEVILLDDASTDNSMEVLEKYEHRADVRIIRNEQNTGSTFKQWLRGIDLARADILWIAESDDVCDPQFLETLVPAFRSPAVKLAYANSYVIDENNRVTGDYIDCEYLATLSKTKWRKSYQVSATEEINDGLGIKNTILNISAVLFRKFKLDNDSRKVLEGMRIAGDWHFIALAIKNGEIRFEARKLNYHRRHSESVIGKTVSGKKVKDFFLEVQTVQQFIFNNYELADGFHEKWESYLRQQWNDFFPDRPFEELNDYYPFDEIKEREFNS
jgi:glycosyltransferase involved in cell wall biosynthesis